MCGINGILSLEYSYYSNLYNHINVMNNLVKHRGPDGEGIWTNNDSFIGFGHRRLSIIDISSGSQPMNIDNNFWITFNGEIYNYIELRQELGEYDFRTSSDTEVILAAYIKWGVKCLDKFRGMFAFSIWDEHNKTLFCARDRFGIKPFYYTVNNKNFFFSSEAKGLLPFCEDIKIDFNGLKDYLSFQFYLEEKTLFHGISQLEAGHYILIKDGKLDKKRYWQVYYDIDFDHTEKYFEEEIKRLLNDSINIHLRSDVPVGAYVSGGLDSSLIASIAKDSYPGEFIGFNGKFPGGEEYDESAFARDVSSFKDFKLLEYEINHKDFINNIEKIIYHLDYPLAGPGAFPQFMLSDFISKHLKVVLGGQGGDEIFGGYVRYLIAYFEQCIKAAIDGTSNSGNFIVTYESIIPNLVSLKNYKPLLKEFWKDGLFEELDKRYFRLISRNNNLSNEINWPINDYSPFESFRSLFKSNNVQKESYFDSMTHFDFKTLLPALLHVEDRVSMANGLETRVPFLDHSLVELCAKIPSNIKFRDGNMKHILKNISVNHLPTSILDRKDKMGFPVPLVDWSQNKIRDFLFDLFSSNKAKNREILNSKPILDNLSKEPKYGRKLWGLVSLEIWQREFIDKKNYFKNMLKN